MPVNDPLGDMIARIHNAQMRSKSKVSMPASRLRSSVLEVLKTEGYIRGFTSVEHANGRNEQMQPLAERLRLKRPWKTAMPTCALERKSPSCS